MRRGPFVIILVLAAALAAGADTIILKSGRRISATEVREEGERVVYETPAGRMSLPKTIVDHVERGPSAIYASGGGGGTAAVAASMAAAPPPVTADSSFDDVVKGVLANGSIDRTYLLKLDGDAQSGGKQAVERMAVGHHAAAQFEMRKGEMDQAVSQYQRALSLAPDHLGLLLNLSGVMIRQSQFTQAIDVLERAQRIAPKDFYVQNFLGIAYYGANKIDQAVDAWKRALAIHPDAEVEQHLEKALRDKEEEASYREGVSSHFNLKYNGASAPALAREVLRTLETHFGSIQSELNYTPTESIGVVLYTEQSFQDITRAPSWAGALNDGRIRVPVEGMTAMTADLSLSLKHELAHSFVNQKTRGHCPVWLNEGIAQWFEGARSGSAAGSFVAAYDQTKKTVALGNLEGVWTGLPANESSVAYAWALSVTEYLVATYGMRDIERALDHMAADPNPEAAMKSVFRSDYSELEEDTIKYLRKTYVR